MQFEELDRVFQSANARLAAAGKEKAFARREFADDVRNEDLAAFGFPGNTGRGGDGGPEQVTIFGDRLPRVYADADTHGAVFTRP